MTVRFLIAEGMASLRRVAAASAIGAFLTGVALVIVSGFTLLAIAYRADLAEARASAAVEVFLDDGIGPERAAAIAAEITGFPSVRSARVRSREELLQLFGGSGDTSIFDAALPLPTTIQLELPDDARSAASVSALGERLRGIEGVEDVAFPSELVSLIDERSDAFVRIAIAVGVALGLSVIGIVAVTSQLTVVSRRSVIRTMSLLGAERRWVMAPFLIQGSLIGLAGGTLATAALYGAWLVIPGLESLLRRGDLEWTPLLFPVAGMLLGLLGSALASGYYLRQEHLL